MFDKDRVSQLLENSDLALARVGHIPLEVRKQLLLMFDKSLKAHHQRVREACAANPLMLGEHRSPCAIFADAGSFAGSKDSEEARRFVELVELPCKDAGLSVLDALDVLQFICPHNYYQQFEAAGSILSQRRVGNGGSRENQLHTLIWRVYCALGEGSSWKAVWNEIQHNHDEYDNEGIIQEVTDTAIHWKSRRGKEQSLEYTSFAATLTAIKKKNQ